MQTDIPPAAATPRIHHLPAGRAALVPIAFGLAVASYALLPAVQAAPVLLRTFLGAGGLLVAWAVWLFVSARSEGRSLALQVLIKKPHWIQACAQTVLLLYWGWHVRAVYGNLPLLFAQLLFAYGLDALLKWSRRETYQLGFGPFPIILSINFFLWFRPEFYYWQFVIVALGYAAKEFIHWTRDGRKRHIFNPSSFPLGVFSLVLILTGTTDATFGLEIAQTLFNPPNIYWVIFLVALPAQMLFGVTTMTIASVLTAYLWSLLYFSVTGAFYFRDAFIPIAVFLGMHLLFTDPATSPRTEVGRVIFGVLYAVFTIAMAAILEAAGVPTFYDKLLPIPLLNTMVRRIDRTAVWLVDRAPQVIVGLHARLSAAQHRLAVVGLWVFAFFGLAATGGVGDDHPGQYLPFWEQACEAGNERACRYVVVLTTNYCNRGSGWACNELGIRLAERRGDRQMALNTMQRACELDFGPGCENVLRVSTGQTAFMRDRPPLSELPIVIRGSKGPVGELTPAELYALACARGWPETCGRQAAGIQTP